MNKVFEGYIVFPDSVVYGQIVTCNDYIIEIILNKKGFLKPDVKFDEDKKICPGFVDLQINGAFGKEFKSDIDAIKVIRNGIYKYGTTSFCPTITTIPLETYNDHIQKLLENIGNYGAKIIGLHLEGPFLNPTKVGAQSASLLKTPVDFDHTSLPIKDISILTLSPELEGAKSLINYLINNKKKIGIGHSVIDHNDLVDIFNKDHMMIVHAFNAMADLNSRKPGLIGAAIDKDEYYVSLIVDGIHVDPVTLRIFWKAKGNKSKIICITDGSSVTGMENGVYQIGTRKIEKRIDRAVIAGTETLVGSILTLNIAAKNLIDFTNCSFSEAINTISLNPATYLGLENEIGQIKVGNFADFAILDKDFNIYETYISGNRL